MEKLIYFIFRSQSYIRVHRKRNITKALGMYNSFGWSAQCPCIKPSVFDDVVVLTNF